MSTTNWATICPLTDIVPNTGVCAKIGSEQVAVFRIGETDMLYAISNYDPFSKANVLSRGLICSIEGKITVASPIYKQHFELSSGKCLEDEAVAIKTYSVRVNENTIEVQAS